MSSIFTRFKVLVEKLASTEMMDYFGTKLDENLLKRLSYSLASINVVVDDAEQQQIRRSTVRTWIGNVKDAMMDAEDVLEEIYIQNLKSKLEETSEPQISSTDTDKGWVLSYQDSGIWFLASSKSVQYKG